MGFIKWPLLQLFYAALFEGLQHLGLSGAGVRPAWTASRGRSASIAVDLSTASSSLDRVDIRDLETRHINCSFGGSVAPLALTGRLLVGSNIEGDEEKEVGAEDDHSRDGGEFLTSTSSDVGHPLPVRRGEVGVGCKVYET